MELGVNLAKTTLRCFRVIGRNVVPNHFEIPLNAQRFLSVGIGHCRFQPLFAFGNEVVNGLGADTALFEVVQSFLDVRFKLAVFQTPAGPDSPEPR